MKGQLSPICYSSVETLNLWLRDYKTTRAKIRVFFAFFVLGLQWSKTKLGLSGIILKSPANCRCPCVGQLLKNLVVVKLQQTFLLLDQWLEFLFYFFSLTFCLILRKYSIFEVRLLMCDWQRWGVETLCTSTAIKFCVQVQW